MASGSSSNADLNAIVDDFYFSVLSHGRNDEADGGDGELFPISDEKYASELQLQEVIMSSVVSVATVCTSPCGGTSSAINNKEAKKVATATPVIVIDECNSYPSSSSRLTSTSNDVTMLVFCKICMDVVLPSNAHRASRGCEHVFCAACLAGYIGAKIQDRVAGVRCPEERCRGELDPELCQDILPREVFERWDAAMCEALVLGSKRTYCPFKDCSAMMLNESGVVVTESECPGCRRLFCARCAVPWHAGVDCAAYNKLGKGDRGKEDLLLLEMAKVKKWKRCPKCEFFVEKSQGCLHIICRCGFEFCYGCGAPWGVTHSSCSTA
ncbi:hypothetical protein GUJ93_ZPchr0008g11555 [Zizania palustris]|uniref:RBR-type E3 ubiquitin transferase n=1 Tax=Zizania palustris TaxID=103762 RepID=A0A8J5VK88_ZIZPA|nr:hypothetical protein GUJ93_ZPchr0008g11555 [Zizania palustris]